MKRFFLSLVATATIMSHNLQAHEREGVGRAGASGVQLVFANIGEGVDRDSYEAVLDLIDVYQREGKVSYVVNRSWGRGGETALCVNLATISDVESFFGKVKSIIVDDGVSSQRTKVEKLAKCI